MTTSVSARPAPLAAPPTRPASPAVDPVDPLPPIPTRRRPFRRGVVVLAAALLVAACSDRADDSALTSEDTRFDVEPGDRFSVVLESNPSTGYTWALAESLPGGVVRLVGDRYLEPDTDLVGAAGRQELTFEAVGDGSTFIQLWYVRPFDDPLQPEDRAQFEVVVGSGVPADAAGPDPDDQPQAPIPDDEDAIGVAELLAERPDGSVVVRAVLFDDGGGLVLCGALAESFPPQCPGDRVPVLNPEGASGIELASSGGVRWTDRPALLVGRLEGDGFRIEGPVSG